MRGHCLLVPGDTGVVLHPQRGEAPCWLLLPAPPLPISLHCCSLESLQPGPGELLHLPGSVPSYIPCLPELICLPQPLPCSSRIFFCPSPPFPRPLTPSTPHLSTHSSVPQKDLTWTVCSPSSPSSSDFPQDPPDPAPVWVKEQPGRGSHFACTSSPPTHPGTLLANLPPPLHCQSQQRPFGC